MEQIISQLLKYEWWQIALILLSSGVPVAVYCILRNFNLTEWRKARDERHRERMQSCCPHAERVLRENGEAYFKSLINSSVKTREGVCSECGKAFPHGRTAELDSEYYYENHIEAYQERVKAYNKLAKKHGRRLLPD
ncbi:MAG: hypothetical protein F4X08_13175 [Gemmatimonadetes bacterium]|nr:hypothetical protein [Gemmatimonadota bacterium]MYI99344.1 hypothetical protein [Gemmatimonadota bacterium]